LAEDQRLRRMQDTKSPRHPHEHLHLTSEEFDEVGGRSRKLSKALDELGVLQRERDEFLAAIVAQKEDVVSA